MKKWIHEKTQVVRTANMSERTAKGHGFIPFEEPALKPVPKPEPESNKAEAVNTEDASKPEAEQPKKKPGRKRTKID